jgi:hypothetical protein
MFSLCLIFAGVFQPYFSLITFWHWMYWTSPIQYMIGATVSNALHDVTVVCTQQELNIIQPPSGMSCGQYLGPFLASPQNLGQLLNPNATSSCEYCRYAEGDAYLASLNMFWSQRWRNFGIFSAYVPLCISSNDRYVIFNFFAIFALFYITRISSRERKKGGHDRKSKIGSVKEAAFNVGKTLEDTFIRKNDGETDKQGMDHVMNSANFAVFQGVGLETFNSRGLGRTWSKRPVEPDGESA